MFRDMLPQRNKRGRLLFTTRTAKIAEMVTAPRELSQLALQPPGIGDGVAMLSVGAGMKRGDRGAASYTDAEQIAQSVRNLPLAFDQAASYIRDTGSSANKIYDMYKSEEEVEVRKDHKCLGGKAYYNLDPFMGEPSLKP